MNPHQRKKRSPAQPSSKRKPLSSKGQAPPLADPRAREKNLLHIDRLLGQQEFASLEEANTFLQNLMQTGDIPAPPNTSPLDQAQDLMYQAWEAKGQRRVTLARQALQLSGDCADAYVLLAEETARSLEEARDLYAQGVKAGERALGPQRLQEDVGHFWGMVETQPYMRARAGLADCLWYLGEQEQAVEHYRDMLRLNPNDNQGIRYVLANCLLELNLDQELGQLLREYGEEATAAWSYTRALWLYRREGASPRANAAREKALRCNRYVPLFLTGQRELPPEPPLNIGLGDEDEAVDYVLRAAEQWLRTPAALAWLAKRPPSGPRSRHLH